MALNEHSIELELLPTKVANAMIKENDLTMQTFFRLVPDTVWINKRLALGESFLPKMESKN